MSTNHTYHTPGDYIVSITASNNGGQGVDDIHVYISGWWVWFILHNTLWYHTWSYAISYNILFLQILLSMLQS